MTTTDVHPQTPPPPTATLGYKLEVGVLPPPPPEPPPPPTATVGYRLEVVILPVADAERTKQFYASLGWREDADVTFTDTHRVLQFTPPGSTASIIFGTGVTDAVPGSGAPLLLAV